jgi:hypothetical protein
MLLYQRLRLPFHIQRPDIFDDTSLDRPDQGIIIPPVQVDPQLTELFDLLDLVSTGLVEAFASLPQSGVNLHADIAGKTDVAKFNYSWAPEDILVRWWQPKKTARIMPGSVVPSNVNVDPDSNLNKSYTTSCRQEDCDLLQEVSIQGAMLFNGGPYHSTHNPILHTGWTMSLLLIDQSTQEILTMAQAIDRFKKFIV